MAPGHLLYMRRCVTEGFVDRQTKIHLVETELPSPIPNLPIKALLIESIDRLGIPEGTTIDERYEKVIEDFVLKPDAQFNDTVHCEAALMALIIDEAAGGFYEVNAP